MNQLSENGVEHPSGNVSPRGAAKAIESGESKSVETKMDGKSVYSLQNQIPSNAYVAYVLLQLNIASISALFINKAIFAEYHFKFPITIYLLQTFCTLIATTGFYFTGVIPDIRLDRKLMIRLIPCAVASWLNVVTGLMALTLVNIPMFSAMRRLTVLFTLGSEIIILKKYPSLSLAMSVFMMGFGSVMSAISDVKFSALGYGLVMFNNSLTALYLVLVKRALEEASDLSSLVLSLYIFSYNAIPTLAIWFFSGEAKQVYLLISSDPVYRSPFFLFLLAMSSISAFFITFASTLATGVTSALTSVVSVQVKNLLQSTIGLVTWDYVPNPTNLMGLFISGISQVMFAVIKYRETQKPSSKSLKQASSGQQNASSVRLNVSGASNTDAR
mmetsp:Transcript_3335/g.5843  ORF Transcript_3335/g.5843 Transcript_3335/m.5843 type:complete len:387 (-) Transcript_3335:68-1228(-)